jgi:SET domain-containing protein
MYLDDPAEYEDISSLYKDDVKAQTLVPLSIQWLGDKVGYGIFAEADILEDEFIGLYTGSIQDRSLVDNKDYAWLYPIQTEDGGAVSLDGYSQGNELRFINDGISPNCVVQYVIGHDNLWHVCYVALTDIKKGEQLLISYGPDYWDTRSYKYQELTDEN